MTIEDVTVGNKHEWNEFVEDHFPFVGAFMQTWEWGEFQKELGREIGRYTVVENEKQIAAFTIVHFALPAGMHYGYVQRGPVIRKDVADDTVITILETIKLWAKKQFPRFVFLRLEPPLSTLPQGLAHLGFRVPPYYIQPRYNMLVSLHANEEEIAASFHPSTRSNLRRAEKRGVSVLMKPAIGQDDYASYCLMMKDTIRRNSGQNAYPGDEYFRSLLRTIPFIGDTNDQHSLLLGAFYGYRDGKPASVHFVLFFGKTATYLYGASHTEHLKAKVDTYLHWLAMKEAKWRGYEYYDLGGIDDSRWPSLTNFKRQFRGEETSYIGNIDIPFNRVSYGAYSLLKRFKHA